MHWRHYPWLLALLLAPILHGCVDLEGKSVVCFLFASSLLLLSNKLAPANQSGTKPIWLWLAFACLLLPLIPIPFALMEWINPLRAQLALDFPLEETVTPTWLASTLSTSQTIHRLTELALIFTAFQLARSASSQPGFPKLLVTTISVSLVLLAASEAWFRFTGQERLLGIWPDTAAHGAGTFANRNHFANWIYVAALFSSGWLLRQYWPLRSIRSQPSTHPARQENRRSITTWLPLIAIVAALIMAVRCGSRASLLVLLTGTLVWSAYLLRRSRNKQRWIAIGGAATLATVALLANANFLYNRFANAGNDIAFKASIWKDASGLVEKFPLLGTGPGTFVTAFNHFKSFGGEQTFLHAENEFLQLWIEHGILGGIILSTLLFVLFRKTFTFAWRQNMPEPELTFGALAALSGYLAHCFLEFVFQIPANALLAAVLLGFVLGQRDTTTKPVVAAPPTQPRILLNLGWGTALLLLSFSLAWSSLQWHQGRHATSPSLQAAHTQAALNFWPWETSRQLALTRLQVAALPASRSLPPSDTSAIRAQLMRTLARDPYNWELRLERACLDLAFPTNLSRATNQAWETVRLNPLQPQIPLRLAQRFAPHDPHQALQFIQSANISRKDHLRQALDRAWDMTGQTDTLWALTPLTPDALNTLADFASERNLAAMANQARQLASSPPETFR